MKLTIGVDGGGTKTEVFTLDIERRRGTICTGGASNPSTVGWTQAVETVEALIHSAIRGAGATTADLVGLSICMAGVDRPEQVEKMKSHFASLFSYSQVEVANDALAALTAGTRGESGIVLIAGTGSIAVGEGTDGRIIRAGGYGYLIGDEGSGFYIGKAGMMAALQSYEGRGPSTVLWKCAKERFDIVSPGEIIPKVYDTSHPVSTIASFARYVLDEASNDAVAERIIEESVSAYVALIESVRGQLTDMISDMVVLAGGLFTNTPVLADKVQMRLPLLQCMVQKERSSAGAALRALALSLGNLWQSDTASNPLIDAWEAAVFNAELV